jgi:hypothetical protein
MSVHLIVAALVVSPPPTVKTPDGEVVCLFEKRYVHCDWSRADDVAAQVTVRGAARIVPGGGLIRRERVPVLKRGESLRVGRLRCTSTRYGMRCVSLVTGNGFRVGPRIRPEMIDGRCAATGPPRT